MNDDTRVLWAETLPEESDGFMDYYYTVKTRENWIQRDEADGQLVSMIHWNPYRMHVRDQIWDTRYVIAVATKKEYRRQGRMAGLLTEGMRKYAAEGMPFVWLMPIDRAIYEPFDFRYVYEKVEGEWPEDIDKYKAVQGREKLTVRVLRQDEYEAAADFLNLELVKRYDVFTERTAEWLEVTEAEVASEDGHIWGIFDKDGLAGVFSEWRGDTVDIREMVCREKYEAGDGRKALILAVRNVLCKETNTPITAITTGWLGEPKPIIMARIINIKEFMKVIRARIPRTIIIRVTDQLIPDNDGTFLWDLTEQGSRIERICQSEETVCVELKLDIAELTEWLFGCREMPGYEDICTLAGVFLNEIV